MWRLETNPSLCTHPQWKSLSFCDNLSGSTMTDVRRSGGPYHGQGPLVLWSRSVVVQRLHSKWCALPATAMTDCIDTKQREREGCSHTRRTVTRARGCIQVISQAQVRKREGVNNKLPCDDPAIQYFLILRTRLWCPKGVHKRGREKRKKMSKALDVNQIIPKMILCFILPGVQSAWLYLLFDEMS